MPEFLLREVPTTDWAMIERIGELRVRAWRTEVPQAADMKTWLDEFDRIARHWAVFNGDNPVAAARLSVHSSLDGVPDAEVFVEFFREPLPTPIASLNRLVVDPTVRGLGLSEKLDGVRMAAAEEMGCGCVIGSTSSGIRRLRQLEKAGFKNAGQGKPYLHPLLCLMPPPSIIICHLPRPQDENRASDA
jgi:GNAT superfamily N-acetyltransferase